MKAENCSITIFRNRFEKMIDQKHEVHVSISIFKNIVDKKHEVLSRNIISVFMEHFPLKIKIALDLYAKMKFPKIVTYVSSIMNTI